MSDCSIRVSDCSIRVSRCFQPFLCLHCFSGVFKRFLQQATRKTYNFVPIISGNHPIIPEYSPILSTTYYSRNYAGIIDACLIIITITMTQLSHFWLPNLSTCLSPLYKILQKQSGWKWGQEQKNSLLHQVC